MSESEQLDELRRFLKDRRARLHPSDVGLPATPRRRVRGLRREEVAGLANIGVSWYTALESGDARGVSDSTLAAVADALRLSDSERSYLFGLTGRSEPVAEVESPSALVLDAMTSISFPAYVITASWRIVACNRAFRLVWNVSADEAPFDAVTRLFIAPAGRRLHGTSPVEHGSRRRWDGPRRARIGCDERRPSRGSVRHGRRAAECARLPQ